jgi:ABC-type amino acid transport substrate-binding protein
MLRVAVLAVAFFVSLTAAFAQMAIPTGSRLHTIAGSHTVKIAYRSDATPFSFRNANAAEPTGFVVDLCRLVVVSIGNQLGGQALKIEWVPVTVQNRFSAIADGQADMECGASTITLKRMQDVDFSSGVFVESTGLLVTKASGIASFDQMNGKKIAVIAGTTNERAVNDQIRARGFGTSIVSVADREAGIAALESGQADGYASDKLLLLGAQVKNPNALAMLPDDLSLEVYGITLPRGDWAMRLAVNAGLSQVYRSGKIVEVFQGWFGQIGLQPGTLLKSLYAIGAIND